MGDYTSSTWTEGVTHAFPDNGTYTVYWGSSARESVENSNGNDWRNQTIVTVGGSYEGNSSPVSAVPPVIQVQDNTQFSYQLVVTDSI